MFLKDAWRERDVYVIGSGPFTIGENGSYLCSASGGAITANLPDVSASTSNGRFLTIKKIDSSTNAVTAVPYGSQTVDGAPSLVLYRQYSATTLVSYGGAWYVVDPYTMARLIQDNRSNPQLFDPVLMNNYALYNLITNAQNRANDGNFSFFNPAAAKDFISINSTTYEVFATFIFRGTQIWTPTKMFAILSRSTASGTSSIRVYDATNALQVVAYTWSTQTRALYTITGLTNLPTTAAIFEFQALRSASNAGAAQMHAIGLYPA